MRRRCMHFAHAHRCVYISVCTHECATHRCMYIGVCTHECATHRCVYIGVCTHECATHRCVYISVCTHECATHRCVYISVCTHECATHRCVYISVCTHECARECTQPREGRVSPSSLYGFILLSGGGGIDDWYISRIGAGKDILEMICWSTCEQLVCVCVCVCGGGGGVGGADAVGLHVGGTPASLLHDLMMRMLCNLMMVLSVGWISGER
jgi:hypothetical protein